jgi:hypothetical protein
MGGLMQTVTITVYLVANQEITLLNKKINTQDIMYVFLNDKGIITDAIFHNTVGKISALPIRHVVKETK